MTRRSVLIGAALLLAFLAIMTIALVKGVASSFNSSTGDGTPSGDALSMVGGLGMLAFGLVALAFGLRALLASPRQPTTTPGRYELAAGWALAAIFLTVAAISAFVHFVPLSDYAKPILGFVLVVAGLASALGAANCFKAAFSSAARDSESPRI